MPDRYRKKPVEVEARQLHASDNGQTVRELAEWCGGWIGGTFDEPWIIIPTLEGKMRASCGDWIVLDRPHRRAGTGGDGEPVLPSVDPARTFSAQSPPREGGLGLYGIGALACRFGTGSKNRNRLVAGADGRVIVERGWAEVEL